MVKCNSLIPEILSFELTHFAPILRQHLGWLCWLQPAGASTTAVARAEINDAKGKHGTFCVRIGPNMLLLILSFFYSFIMFYHYCHYCHFINIYSIIEGSLEVKLPTIWTDEKQSRAEAERRERLEERRSEKRKSQKKEDADARKGRKVAKHCVFLMI